MVNGWVTVIGVLTTLTGFASGIVLEHIRYKHSIQSMGVKDRIDAYNVFLSSLRELCTFTGKNIASSRSYIGNAELCMELRMELFDKVSKLITLSRNPFILNDQNVIVVTDKVNEHSASIETRLIGCANGEAESWAYCVASHNKMMDSIREFEQSVADKFGKNFGDLLL